MFVSEFCFVLGILPTLLPTLMDRKICKDDSYRTVYGNSKLARLPMAALLELLKVQKDGSYATPMEYGLFPLEEQQELKRGFKFYPKDDSNGFAFKFENDYVAILVFPGSAAFVNPKKGGLTNWARIGVCLPVYLEGYGILNVPLTCSEAFFKLLSGVFAFCTADDLSDEDKAKRTSILCDMVARIINADSPKKVKGSSFACPQDLFDKKPWDGPDAEDGRLGLAYECMIATLLFKLVNAKVFEHFTGLLGFLWREYGVSSGSVYWSEFKEDKRWGAGMNCEAAVSRAVSFVVTFSISWLISCVSLTDGQGLPGLDWRRPGLYAPLL